MKRITFLKHVALGMGASMLPFPSIAKTETKPLGDSKPKIVRGPEGRLLNVLGDAMKVKLTGADTDGQFTLIEEWNDPGVAIPLHVHTQEDEIFHVLEGSLELTVGDTTTLLKAGDLAFGPRNVPHMWKTVGPGKTKVLLSAFPSGIEDLFEKLNALPEGPPDFEKVAALCGAHGITFVTP
jgi:quercetin dioxygenase-like cupin family protein